MSNECDAFNDALDNEDCRVILLNCFKNLEKEVKTIWSLVNQNSQTQIIWKQSLPDLSKLVKINRYLLSIYAESILKVFKHFKSPGVWSLGVGFWCFNIRWSLGETKLTFWSSGKTRTKIWSVGRQNKNNYIWLLGPVFFKK